MKHWVQWLTNVLTRNNRAKALAEQKAKAKAEEVPASTFEEAKWLVYQYDGRQRWVKDKLTAFDGDMVVEIKPHHRLIWDATGMKETAT